MVLILATVQQCMLWTADPPHKINCKWPPYRMTEQSFTPGVKVEDGSASTFHQFEMNSNIFGRLKLSTPHTCLPAYPLSKTTTKWVSWKCCLNPLGMTKNTYGCLKWVPDLTNKGFPEFSPVWSWSQQIQLSTHYNIYKNINSKQSIFCLVFAFYMHTNTHKQTHTKMSHMIRNKVCRGGTAV